MVIPDTAQRVREHQAIELPLWRRAWRFLQWAFARPILPRSVESAPCGCVAAGDPPKGKMTPGESPRGSPWAERGEGGR